MNTSRAPARGVIWSLSTTSPRTATTLLRLTVLSGRAFAVPGFGADMPGCSIVGRFFGGIESLPPGITLGGLLGICSTVGPPPGAGGKKLAPVGGHGGGHGGG